MKVLLLTGAMNGEKVLLNMEHVIGCDLSGKNTIVVTINETWRIEVTETPTEIYNLLNTPQSQEHPNDY